MTTMPEDTQQTTDAPVTLAQLTQLLTGFKQEVLNEVNTANAGAVASMKKSLQKTLEQQQPPAQVQPEVESSAEDGNSQKLTLKALQTQLAQMQAERDQERKDAFIAKRGSALTQAIAASGALNQKALYKLLQVEYGDAVKEEQGAWFVARSEDEVVPLEKAVAAYLATDEGHFFLPPSGVQGSGSTETKGAPTTGKPEYSSRLEKMTAELKSGEAKIAF
ncbi:hypothetical protein [Pseudanabaena sp. FACHB-2040]|uniref:hypothetical protein n=1 Tax=Pseudanabaena sp. FACHB-2040 TaxID=2692859 RepID=UPI00168745C3|nr:hypothetical protein [Pseudanabaena sp. FACHB-2040]MBD2256661.1 hypothetical protein [Pseudanabaena sp. FACHB-2040]